MAKCFETKSHDYFFLSLPVASFFLSLIFAPAALCGEYEDLENDIHKEEEAMLEHTLRLHTRKTIYLSLTLFACTRLRFITVYESLFAFHLKMITQSHRNVV